jgi:5-hydroxyisourate hydrolase
MNISTHVLDGTYGKAAAGVRAYLARADGVDWITIGSAETNTDGYIEEWRSRRLRHGLYRMVFDSDEYFASLGGMPAYPEVTVIFRVTSEARTLLVQITLSPNSYSAYFGTMEDKTIAQPIARETDDETKLET